MPAQNNTTNVKKPNVTELQARIRQLELELAAYKIFGSPLEIAIAIYAKARRCYYCELPIDDFQKVQLIETSHDKYWLHERCMDQGVDKIRHVEQQYSGTGLVKSS